MSTQLKKRFETKTPKRILALDGGGIRGALSLGYLAEIETILRDRYNDPEFLLCDYFDLIGGTSTGSIIAGALAIGMSVEEIRVRYSQLGATIFGDARYLSLFRTAKFSPTALEKGLQETFGDRKLGDENIRTGVCIFAKRVDTQSLWTLNNNPDFPYYHHTKDIELWEAIRASAAAPTFFDPVGIEARSDGEMPTVRGVFTDGGVSPANNPALWLLMMAQVKGYGYNWESGEDKLLVTSVGTGRSVMTFDPAKVEDWRTLNWASQIPNIMMSDFTEYNEIIMQLLSTSPTRRTYDSTMKDLSGDHLGKDPVCSYLRYNILLTKENLCALDKKYNDLTEKDIECLCDFTEGENVKELYQIGRLTALQEVKAEHFSDVFDVK